MRGAELLLEITTGTPELEEVRLSESQGEFE